MSQTKRFSIDTLYFGLRMYEEELNDFFKEIKNYLFFFNEKEINIHFCKNRFYKYMFDESKNFGFIMFLYPRPNCRNDFITIELSGTFFKNIPLSFEFCNWIFGKYGLRVNFQRIDVACDVIYDSVDGLEVENKTHLLAFPYPSYSGDWHKARIPFSFYGRSVGNDFFVNMVYQGKNDTRLRVYDKNLDLMEKYNICYDSYYSLNINANLVYRIEFQLRGDKLKFFISNIIDDVDFEFNYFSLVAFIFKYVFSKYDFENFDKECISVNLYSPYCKREKNLYKELDYCRRQMFEFYRKYLNKFDEIKFLEANNKQFKNFKLDSYYRENLNKCSVPFSKEFQGEFLDLYDEYSIFCSDTKKQCPF